MTLGQIAFWMLVLGACFISHADDSRRPVVRVTCVAFAGMAWLLALACMGVLAWRAAA